MLAAAHIATSAIGGAASGINSVAERKHETAMQKRALHYYGAGQLLDYKKAMRLGNMRKDVAMAQFGYNANATMRGAGNSFNTNSNSVATSTTPTNRDASTQAGRVNMRPRAMDPMTPPTLTRTSASFPPAGSSPTPYAQMPVTNVSAGQESVA